MFTNTPFVLASSSSSRRLILQKVQLKFIIQKPKCDEDTIKKTMKKRKTKPIKIVKILAEEKAKSISGKHLNKIVIGCDTVIVFRGKMIDKAKNLKEAFNKIKKLSGKKHKIITSISAHKHNRQIWSHTQSSTVKLRKLEDKDIKNYLKQSGKKILKCVGCYQAEGFGPAIIEEIEGDFFNVMGFPLFPFLKFFL